jgi:hypothetical protein
LPLLHSDCSGPRCANEPSDEVPSVWTGNHPANCDGNNTTRDTCQDCEKIERARQLIELDKSDSLFHDAALLTAGTDFEKRDCAAGNDWSLGLAPGS